MFSLRNVFLVCSLAFSAFALCSFAFGANSSKVRYRVDPTNVVLRIDGTNYFVRYAKDFLLNTNVIVSLEPVSSNDFEEVSNE